MKKFKFIDLFAGAGGIRIPFSELGGECVFTSEWDKFAQKTYEDNFGEKVHGDITKIKEEDIPDHDVLLGGFPCQAFSQAGNKKGFNDTRGTLFFDVLRIIKHKNPKVILLENVKGLVSHDKGRTLKIILEELNKAGYDVQYKVLFAKDFGLPQNRPRIYIVGTRTDLEIEINFPTPPQTQTKLANILEKNVDSKYTISDKLWSYLQKRKKEQKAKGNGFGFSLFNKDAIYVNTISARYYKDGSEILINQGNSKNPRKLTPREAARLQGFPDDFKITVSNTQFYKQMGNSVAINVIRAIAKEIVKNF